MISLVGSLLIVSRLMSEDVTATSNTIDVVTDILLITGFVAFVRAGVAGRWLGRVGLSLTLLGLLGYLVASVAGFISPDAGEIFHPISVPLTGLGMLFTGAATLRTGLWTGWQRFTPLLCGVVPFVIELPGFIFFGDSPNLQAFVAITWASWLLLFVATWTNASLRPQPSVRTGPAIRASA